MLDETVDYNKVLVTWYPSRDPHFVPSKSDYKIDKQDKNLIMYDGRGPVYVMDPLGILHDKNGHPLIIEGGYLVSKIKNVELEVDKTRDPNTWSGFWATPIFKGVSRGTIYRTNKRLIFVQEPNPVGQIQQGGGPFGLPASVPAASWAKKLRKSGRKDCISIPLTTIVRCKKKKYKVAVLFIQGWNARYKGLITHLENFSILEGLPEKG